MIAFLTGVFKLLLLIFGIMLLGALIASLIATPFKNKKEKEAKKDFTDALKKSADALEKITNECIEELAKEEKNKKTTKKTTKSVKKSKEK